MKNEFKRSEKTIHFCCSHPQIENLMIQIVNQCGGLEDMNVAFIKWNIAYDTDLRPSEEIRIFLIDSLKPLRVMTGVAAMEHSYFTGISQPEAEIIEFVEGLTADEIMTLSANAIPIGINDKLQLFVPAGTPLKLSSGNEYTDMIVNEEEVLRVDEIFTPQHLIKLQLRNKNPNAPVNVYIKNKYGMQSIEELISTGMNTEEAKEIIGIIAELDENK